MLQCRQLYGDREATATSLTYEHITFAIIDALSVIASDKKVHIFRTKVNGIDPYLNGSAICSMMAISKDQIVLFGGRKTRSFLNLSYVMVNPSGFFDWKSTLYPQWLEGPGWNGAIQISGREREYSELSALRSVCNRMP